jgi:murein DD-endopeptidase MepM/ murein hydrolase activator NlpD
MAITPGAGKDTYDTTIDQGVYFYSTHSKTKGETLGEKFFSALRGAEDDSLMFSIYENRMSRENTKLLAEKTAPNSGSFSYGTNVHNISGALDNLSDASTALGYRVFRGQRGYGTVVNEVAEAAGLDPIYKEKPQGLELGARTVNAVTYGTMAAVTSVAAGLAVKQLGKSSLTASSIVLSSAIAGAVGSVFGAIFAAPNLDDYGAKRFDTAIGFAARSLTTPYGTYADTGVGADGYEQLLGALPAVLVTGGVYASAAIINKVTKKSLINPNVVGEALLSALPGNVAKKGLAPVVTFGLAAAAGAMIGATRIGTAAKYRGDAPERGKFVPGIYNSRDQGLREFSGSRQPYTPEFQHEKVIVTSKEAKKQFAIVMTGNLNAIQQNAKGGRGQYNIGLYLTDPKEVAGVRQAVEYRLRNRKNVREGKPYEAPPEIENVIFGGPRSNSIDRFNQLIRGSGDKPLYTVFSYATSEKFFAQLESEARKGRTINMLFQNPYGVKAGGNPEKMQAGINRVMRAARDAGNTNVSLYTNKRDSNLLIHAKAIAAEGAFLTQGSNNISNASEKDNEEMNVVTKNNKVIGDFIKDFKTFIKQDDIVRLDVARVDSYKKDAERILQSGKSQYDLGIFANLHRPNYSLKDSSTLTSIGAAQAARSTMPGVAYLPNKLSNQFFLDNRGQRPNLFQNWFYAMTGTTPSTDNFLGIGPSQAEILRQADAQLSPFLSFNPTQWGETRGLGVLFNERVGGEFYVDGSGLAGNLAKGLGRVLDIATGYYGLARLHELRTGAAPRDDIKLLHQQQGTAKPDRGFFESLLSETVDTVKATATSLLFYFGFSHALSLVQQHVETVGLNSVLNAITAPEGSARREQLKMLVSAPQLRVLQSAYTIKNAVEEGSSLKMLSASFQSIFDTAALNAVTDVTGGANVIARGLVDGDRVDALSRYLDTLPDDSDFKVGLTNDMSAMQGRISRLLKAEGITSTSAEVDVQAALQKVLATHLGYDQGSGTLSLDKPLFNDKLTFAERGGTARLGSLRRIDSSNFRQALRPILESIALPREQATFSGALDTFDRLISAQPAIQFIDDNTSSPVQFINYGMERLKEVATQLDIIASDIPANPFLWSPAIRSALNITSLEVQQDGRDLSLKSFLGSGSFEAMIKTQKEIFRTVQNIASKGLFREIAQARAVFAISDSLAKQETMIAAKLAEDLSQTNVTALQQLVTNYAEERLEFTAAVKAGNRSLEPTDVQQSGYKRTRKLLMGMGAILVGDAVIDRYFLQNEGGDFFNQLQRFSIASQLVKDSEPPYAGDDRTEQERIYNTEFTGVVPRYLRAPIILAGAYAGGRMGFDVRYSDTLSNIKQADVDKLDSLGDEVAKLKDLFTQSNKRLVTKFSNLGAYFGAMTAIMGTQLAFSTAAAAANTARTAWHSEGLKMQGEGAVASGKIAVALRNTLSDYRATAFADQPNASESQVVNDLFTRDKATATRMAVATLMAEGIAKSQTEGMRPQYTFAHQIPNPIFQLAFVGKLDPKGETISIGAGFQFLPLLGAGSIPALPLSVRIKPNNEIRHLAAREIDYRDQETDTQGTGYFISRLFGQLTSSIVFDPNSQMNAVLGVATGANIARFAASKMAGRLQPNAELAEIYKGTKVVRDGAMFVADQSEKLMRWSQAPMLAAPNSAFKALMSVMASYENDYPTLLTAIGPIARTATAFLLPLLFASASMSVDSTYDYIGSGIEALSGQTEDAEQSYADGLNNARWYRAGGVISTTAIYGGSLYKFGAFKPAKSFSGGVNGTVLRRIYERGAAQGLSKMREAGGASTFLGSVSLFEQEVAAVPNVNADELDARFAKRLVNEFEAQERALKNVFDAAGVNQYALLHKQTDESEAAIKAVLKEAIETNNFTDTDSVFGRFMRESFGDLHKTVGTHEFTSNLDDYTNVAYNRFKAQSKEVIKLAQKIEPSMYHTAPRRIGVIATAIAVPFVAMNIMASLLVDSDTFVEKPSDGFLMGLAKVPLLLASGTSAEHRMSAEARQKIASYRQSVGLVGRPEAPKNLGDTLLGLLEMINPVRIFNPVSPYKDNPKEFVNVFGPLGMSNGSRGWTHYTQVQSMAADASTSQYYMQAAVFQSADAAAIRAVNKLDPQTDLDVINAWRAKQARQKPMSLKGTASRSESQAVSGATPALAMALAQRQSAASWLSYQHADDIKNDFLMQMLYTGRVMGATVGNVPFKADYLGWTPFDAGLISEFIVGGTLGQPSDAAQKLQTFTSAVKGAGNWLATGDFKDQFDYSLFNKTSNTQTQSPIPLIGTFIDLGRYVIGGMFDPQTKKLNAVPTIAAMTMVTAFGATLALASAGSLYFAGSAVTAALAAYKEGGDYRNLTSNIKENIDQIAAKSLVARFDNTGEYGRLMLTNDRIMHTGGRVLRVLDQALDQGQSGEALASGVTGIINQFNQDLAAIGMLNSNALAAAVKSNNASEVIDLVKEDLVKAFNKSLPQIGRQDLTLAQLLKFHEDTSFLKTTEYSGVLNSLETNLHTIFNSKMDNQLKIARAQELLTKSLLDIKQSTYRSSGENDLNYKPSRYGKGHSTDSDLAFKSRLLYKETDYYAESLGELVSRYGAAGTLGRAALGVGSIAGSYLDVAQTWYPLLTATTALGADKRSDRVRAAQVLGSYTFETLASVGIAQLLRKAPGKTIVGAIGVGVLAGIDKTLLKGEMWNTVQRFARVADQKLMRPFENMVTGVATFVSDIPLFRGIAKPLGIPFRALDPFINNLHQKAEGTGWANFTMFFLPHTVESRYNMSAQSSMGMETAFGVRPYEISSEETRQHQQQLADQRFNRAVSVNKKPDEQLVSHELLGGQATLEAQIFYDKHLDNKGYLVDRVMSDFGPRAQLSSLMIVAASARAYEADYVDARRTREMLPTTSYGLAYAALETIHSLEAISKAKYGDPHKLFFRAAEEGVLAVNEMILFQHHAKGIVRQGASDIFGRLAKLLPGRAGDVNKIASGNILLSALPRLMGVGAATAFTYYSLTDGDNEQLEKNAAGITAGVGLVSGATSFLTSTTGKNQLLKGLAKTTVVKDWAEKNKVVDKAKGWSNKMPESLVWGALFGVAMSGNVHSGLNFIANLFADPEDVEARKVKGEDTVPGGASLIASIVGFTGWMAATRAKYNYTETRDHLANLKEFKTPKSVNTWVGRAVIGAFIGQYIGQGIAHGIAGATSFLNLTAGGAAPNTEQEKENKGWFIAAMGGAGAVATSAAFIKSKSLLEGINTVAHATLIPLKWPALWLKDGLSRLVAMMPDGSKAREVYSAADDFVVNANDPNLKGGLLRNFKAGALKRLHHFSPQFKAVKKALAPLVPIAMHTGVDSFLTLASFMQVDKVDILSRQSEAHAATKGALDQMLNVASAGLLANAGLSSLGTTMALQSTLTPYLSEIWGDQLIDQELAGGKGFGVKEGLQTGLVGFTAGVTAIRGAQAYGVPVAKALADQAPLASTFLDVAALGFSQLTQFEYRRKMTSPQAGRHYERVIRMQQEQVAGSLLMSAGLAAGAKGLPFAAAGLFSFVYSAIKPEEHKLIHAGLLTKEDYQGANTWRQNVGLFAGLLAAAGYAAITGGRGISQFAHISRMVTAAAVGADAGGNLGYDAYIAANKPKHEDDNPLDMFEGMINSLLINVAIPALIPIILRKTANQYGVVKKHTLNARTIAGYKKDTPITEEVLSSIAKTIQDDMGVKPDEQIGLTPRVTVDPGNLAPGGAASVTPREVEPVTAPGRSFVKGGTVLTEYDKAGQFINVTSENLNRIDSLPLAYRTMLHEIVHHRNALAGATTPEQAYSRYQVRESLNPLRSRLRQNTADSYTVMWRALESTLQGYKPEDLQALTKAGVGDASRQRLVITVLDEISAAASDQRAGRTIQGFGNNKYDRFDTTEKVNDIKQLDELVKANKSAGFISDILEKEGFSYQDILNDKIKVDVAKPVTKESTAVEVGKTPTVSETTATPQPTPARPTTEQTVKPAPAPKVDVTSTPVESVLPGLKPAAVEVASIHAQGYDVLSYNSSINYLQTEVKGLQDSLSKVGGQLTNLRVETAVLSSEITKLESGLDTLRGESNQINGVTLDYLARKSIDDFSTLTVRQLTLTNTINSGSGLSKLGYVIGRFLGLSGPDMGELEDVLEEKRAIREALSGKGLTLDDGEMFTQHNRLQQLDTEINNQNTLLATRQTELGLLNDQVSLLHNNQVVLQTDISEINNRITTLGNYNTYFGAETNQLQSAMADPKQSGVVRQLAEKEFNRRQGQITKKQADDARAEQERVRKQQEVEARAKQQKTTTVTPPQRPVTPTPLNNVVSPVAPPAPTKTPWYELDSSQIRKSALDLAKSLEGTTLQTKLETLHRAGFLSLMPTDDGGQTLAATFSKRPIVTVDFGTMKSPLYVSTGYGGKSWDTGRWYGIMGFGKNSGWFNKVDASETGYGSSVMQDAMFVLDTVLGDVRGDGSLTTVQDYGAFHQWGSAPDTFVKGMTPGDHLAPAGVGVEPAYEQVVAEVRKVQSNEKLYTESLGAVDSKRQSVVQQVESPQPQKPQPSPQPKTPNPKPQPVNDLVTPLSSEAASKRVDIFEKIMGDIQLGMSSQNPTDFMKGISSGGLTGYSLNKGTVADLAVSATYTQRELKEKGITFVTSIGKSGNAIFSGYTAAYEFGDNAVFIRRFGLTDSYYKSVSNRPTTAYTLSISYKQNIGVTALEADLFQLLKDNNYKGGYVVTSQAQQHYGSMVLTTSSLEELHTMENLINKKQGQHIERTVFLTQSTIGDKASQVAPHSIISNYYKNDINAPLFTPDQARSYYEQVRGVESPLVVTAGGTPSVPETGLPKTVEPVTAPGQTSQPAPTRPAEVTKPAPTIAPPRPAPDSTTVINQANNQVVAPVAQPQLAITPPPTSPVAQPKPPESKQFDEPIVKSQPIDTNQTHNLVELRQQLDSFATQRDSLSTRQAALTNDINTLNQQVEGLRKQGIGGADFNKGLQDLHAQHSLITKEIANSQQKSKSSSFLPPNVHQMTYFSELATDPIGLYNSNIIDHLSGETKRYTLLAVKDHLSSLGVSNSHLTESVLPKTYRQFIKAVVSQRHYEDHKFRKDISGSKNPIFKFFSNLTDSHLHKLKSAADKENKLLINEYGVPIDKLHTPLSQQQASNYYQPDSNKIADVASKQQTQELDRLNQEISTRQQQLTNFNQLNSQLTTSQGQLSDVRRQLQTFDQSISELNQRISDIESIKPIEPPAPTKPSPNAAAATSAVKPVVEVAQSSVAGPLQRTVEISPNNLVDVGASGSRTVGLLPPSVTGPKPTISNRRLQAQRRLDAGNVLPSSQQPIITPASSPQASFTILQPDAPFTPQLLGKGQFGYAYTTSADTVRKVMFSSMYGPKEAAIQSYAGELGVAPKVKAVYQSIDAETSKPFFSAIDMDYVDGKTFMNPSMSVTQRKAALTQVARLHANNIIHADLHSQNVLETSTGDVRIIDYGQAWVVDPRFDKPDMVERSKQAELNKFRDGLQEGSKDWLDVTEHYQRQVEIASAGAPSERFNPDSEIQRLQANAPIITAEDLAPQGIQNAAARQVNPVVIQPAALPQQSSRLGIGGAVKTGFKTGVKAGLADIGVQASRSGVKLSFSEFKAGQLGKANVITTGLDVGVTVVEGALKGDSWGTTAKKAGWSLLSGLAFGAVMQGAVAGITAGLTAAGAAGAAAVFSTVVVPVAVIGLLAYGAYDTVTRLGKAYGDYKKRNNLSDGDVRDNVVKGISGFFTRAAKKEESKPTEIRREKAESTKEVVVVPPKVEPEPLRPTTKKSVDYTLPETKSSTVSPNSLRHTKSIQFEIDSYTKKPTELVYTIEGKKVKGKKVEGRNKIYSDGIWYHVSDQIDKTTFNSAKKVKNQEEIESVIAGKDMYVVPIINSDWNSTVKALAKNKVQVVGVIGSGFSQNLDKLPKDKRRNAQDVGVRQVGYQYADLGKKGKSKEDYEANRLYLAKYRAGYYTDSKGQVRVIDLPEESSREFVEKHVNKLKAEGAKSISIQAAFAYDGQKAKDKRVVLGKEGTRETDDLEKRGGMVFDKDGKYLGYVTTPMVHQADIFAAAEQIFKGKVGKVVPTDGDRFASYHLQGSKEKQNTPAKSYPGAILLVREVKEGEKVVIAGKSLIEQVSSTLDVYTDKAGDAWTRIIRPTIGSWANNTYKALSNIPIIGDIFFPKKAAASDLSAMQSTAKKEQAKLDQMKSLNNRQRRRDNTFSEEYRAYEERVEKPEGNAVTRFFGGIWKSIKEAGENLTSALFKTKKGIEREVINIAKWLRDGGIQKVLGMVGDAIGDAIGGAIDSITGGGQAYKGNLLDVNPIAKQIHDTAVRLGFDPVLALAMAAKESGGGNPYHIRHNKADGSIMQSPSKDSYGPFVGSMQVGWGAAVEAGYAKQDRYDQQKNIEIGIKYLDKLIKQYKGDVRKALAAYNAGGGRLAAGYGYADSVLGIKDKVQAGLTAVGSPNGSARSVKGAVILDVKTSHAGGGGAGPYHIDFAFNPNIGLTMADKVKMFEPVYETYKGMGRRIEFSNSAVGGVVYKGTQTEKEKIMRRAEAAHTGRKSGRNNYPIDFYVPKQGSGRYTGNAVVSNDSGGAHVPFVIPIIEGGYYVVGKFQPEAGQKITGYDSKGRWIYEAYHGEHGKTGKFYFSEQAVTATQNNPAANMVIGPPPKGTKYADAPTSSLVKINDSSNQRGERQAVASITKMLDDLKKATGVDLWVVSGFRSKAEQQAIWDRKRKAGQTDAQIAKANARPGESQHHTGQAFDFDLQGGGSLNAKDWSSGERKKALEWMQKNAAKYGFYMPYSQANNNGVQYEPWHWMYGGVGNNNQVAQQPKKFKAPTDKRIQSYVIQDIASGKVIASSNANKAPASPASTIKLIIADLIIQSIKKGDLKLDTVLTVKKGEQADGSSIKAGSKHTVQSLINKMLKDSDNTSANVLINALGGTSSATSKARSRGYSGTTIANLLSIPGATGFRNASNAADVTKAAGYILTGTDAASQAASGALRQTRNFGYSNEAGGKIGNNSRVIGNVGIVTIGGRDFLVTAFANVDGNNKANRQIIKDFTNNVIGQLGSVQSNVLPTKQNKVVATNLKNQLNQISVTALAPIVNLLFKGEGGVESINVIQRDGKGDRIAGRASTFQAEFGKSAGETTLAEIRARQQQKGVVQGKSEIGAVGFPQFIGNTLGRAMATLGLEGNTKFTKEVQGQLLMTLLFIKRPEIGAYLTGQKGSSVKEAAQALAREFASVGLSYDEAPAQQLRDSNSPVKPDHERKREKGQSLYEGVNANKAHITPEEAQRQLKAARDLVMKSLNGKQFTMPNIAFGEGGEMANLAQQAADSYKDLPTVSQSVGSPSSQLQQLIAGLSPYAADQLLRGNFSIPFIRSLSRQVRANLSLLMSNPGELIKKAFAGVGNAVSAGVDAVKDALGFSGENIQVEGGTKLTKANINSRYGPRGGRMHRGVDVAAVNGRGANGLYISFALGGKVIDIANDPGGWGNNALVELANGVRYRIAHMQERPYIKVGQTFNAGQAIGRVGSTGRSTGPHLHFEKLGPDGKQVDPTNDIGVVILGGSKSVGVRQAGTNQPSKPPAPKPTPDKTSSVIEKQKQEKVAQSMQKPETDNTAAMNAIASIKGQLPPEQADLIQQFLEQAEIVSDQKAREVVKAKATRVVVIEKPDEVADTNSGYKVAVQGKRHKVGATAQPVIVKSQDGDREVYRYIHMESEAEVQYASINPYGGVDQNTMNAHSHNTSTESVPSSGNNQHGGYKEVG